MIGNYSRPLTGTDTHVHQKTHVYLSTAEMDGLGDGGRFGGLSVLSSVVCVPFQQYFVQWLPSAYHFYF